MIIMLIMIIMIIKQAPWSNGRQDLEKHAEMFCRTASTLLDL